MLAVFFAFCTAFLVTIISIPSIIKVAEIKGLIDEPGGRKAHASSVPTLGGIAIFAGCLLGFTFFADFATFPRLNYLMAALIIIFFVGIKDDIVNLVALKKFVAQVLSATILVMLVNVRITNMYGIFGIHELPYVISVILSIFTVVTIINAFNVIDGLDGLAGGVGFLSSLTFGTWFIFMDEVTYAILSFSMAGSLLAFLRYNISPARIFMGDTGSMLAGFILAALAIKFIESAPGIRFFESNNIAPVMAISILILPLYDMCRVFAVRLIKGRSPFEADRNHIHHCLIDIGFSHRVSSMILHVVSLGFIVFAYLLKDLEINLALILVSLSALLLSQVPFLVKGRLKRSKEKIP